MISGFTLVRNARLLDYPFEESVRSLLALCDEVVINVGDSTDDTLAMCEALKKESNGKIRLIHSVWNRENQTGGYQLRCQTDAALAECKGQWCIYLQADEVLHESDVTRIRRSMLEADQREDVDGIVFDYLHFYGNFDYYITGRNWYRREMRAFKNGRGIEAFRDAQGFRKNGKRLSAMMSGARVYHYGHVRSAVSLSNKSKEMSQWWGESPVDNVEKNRPRRHIGLRRFRESHPAVMQARVLTNENYYDPTKGPRSWDKDELKNAITFAWEALVPFRIGEFRNYDLKR